MSEERQKKYSAGVFVKDSVGREFSVTAELELTEEQKDLINYALRCGVVPTFYLTEHPESWRCPGYTDKGHP